MKRRDFIKIAGIGCLGCCCPPGLLVKSASAATGARGAASAFPFRLAGLGTSPFSLSAAGKAYDAGELLATYDDPEYAKKRRDMYLEIFDGPSVDGILAEMRASYEALIPDIPFIGKNNFHLQWVIPNMEKLAEYIVARNYGISADVFSRMYIKRATYDLLAQPEEDRKMIGQMQFGPVAETLMRYVAFRSQLKLFPDDYILSFVPGDGKNFDWGLDYTQCTNVIVYKKFDALEVLYPMVCAMDYVAGMTMHVGYYRTKTLVKGDSICDLRWKWQG